MSQVEIMNLDFLVLESHIYRQFASIWSFKLTEKKLKKLEKDNTYKGFGILYLFKCLLLKFMGDQRDHELTVYWASFMEMIGFNLKCLVALQAPEALLA